MKKEIENLEDIQLLVDTFYGKVRVDALLGGIFNGAIGDRWDEHLEKLHRFWQTVLLREHTYHGTPFRPHATLPVEKAHFERWIFLFHETIDDFFTGETADFAKKQSELMAEMFMHKIAYYRKDPSNFISQLYPH